MLTCNFFISCQPPKENSALNTVNWNKRKATFTKDIPLEKGTSYLSVYSQVYSQTEHRTHNLTVTVSLRNLNSHDTVYIDKAAYFDTHGKSIRTYFKHPIYIAPMETVEIVIDESDKHGGTGGNFLFDWRIHPDSNEPLFEAVMISTSGQQGISFITNGKRIE